MIRRHPHKHVRLCLVLEEKLWKQQLWYEDSVTLVQPLVLSQFLHDWSRNRTGLRSWKLLPYMYNFSGSSQLYIAYVYFMFFCRTKSPFFRGIVSVFILKQEFLAHRQWVSQISGCQPEKERLWALLMWQSVNLKRRAPPGKVCAFLISLTSPSHIRDMAQFCW